MLRTCFSASGSMMDAQERILSVIAFMTVSFSIPTILDGLGAWNRTKTFGFRRRNAAITLRPVGWTGGLEPTCQRFTAAVLNPLHRPPWSTRQESNLHHAPIWDLRGISSAHCHCATGGGADGGI